MKGGFRNSNWRMWLFALGLIVWPGSARVEAPPCLPQPFKIHMEKLGDAVFHVGERFRYKLNYEFIPAGEATLEVRKGPLVNCRETYIFQSTAKSAKYIDAVFKVRDFNSAIVDRESLASYMFHQNLSEGGYDVIRTTTIDYVNGSYKFVKEHKGKTETADGAVDQLFSDILSSFYKTRMLSLELGSEYYVPVFSDGKTYRLRVKVFSKFEDVDVPAGRFECIKIQPFVLGDGIFKARDGQMTIWLTSDERKIPVLIRSKVAIGAFDAELLEFDTPKTDMVNEKVPT